MNMRHFIACAAILGLTPLSFAAPAAAETVAIVGGTVHTMGAAGVIANGTVIIDGGVITAVGAGLPAPAGARVIDAKGAEVTPGLMSSYTFLGLREVVQDETTDDTTAAKAEFSAAFDVSYGLNPAALTIPVTRHHGVTRAFTAPIPSKTVFAGQGALISLDDMRLWVKPRVAMVMTLSQYGASLSGGARGASWVFLRQAFQDARYYQQNRRDVDKGDSRDTVLPRIDLEALIPMLDGKMPLVIETYRESDIRQVIALATEFKLKVVLLNASEAWKVADALAAAGIAVIADPRDNLPARFENLNATLENVPKLVKAGVKVAIATTGDALEQRYGNLTQFAGIAVANGLSREQALAAITRVPAEIWGISASYGTLEKGKDADVVVWSGDPLELSSIPTAMFIRGQAQDLSSRQTKLRDRYKDLKTQEPPLGYR